MVIDGMSGGAILGIVFGVMIAICLAAVITVVIYKGGASMPSIPAFIDCRKTEETEAIVKFENPSYTEDVKMEIITPPPRDSVA